ncbi:MFS transporter [Brevibacillus dissolubilis]|uniref:MFS transporter n=1 Tax=Brevibacillus dissolubilis TaxID=1844116 RepID=UPI001116B7B5|nr:MFS transporter [Brevibacillus dissolubilis]
MQTRASLPHRKRSGGNSFRGRNPFYRRNPFFVLWLGQFFSIGSLTVLVPLLPFYMETLGAGGEEDARFWTGLCLAAPAITLFLTSPLWGRYGDRFGRKWMIVRALFGIGGSLGLMAVAQTPMQFFLARLVQGAFGGIVDATAAFAGAEAEEGKQGRVLGRLQSATAAGSLIGPLIGGTMADVFGFQTILYGTAVLTALCGVMAAWVLQEPKQAVAGKGREAADTPIPLTKAFWQLLSHRRVPPFLLAGMLAQFGAFSLVTVFAPRVEELVGHGNYAATWVGVLQAVTWGATMLAAPWWGRQNDRHPVEKNLRLALLGCGVSVMLQIVPADVSWMIPLRIVQGVCFAAIVPSIFLVITQETKACDRGMHIGISNSVMVFGQIAGSLGGAMFGSILSMEWTFVIMGASFLGGAVWLACGTCKAEPAWYMKMIRMRWRVKNDKQIHG